jgi:hypothetical protein
MDFNDYAVRQITADRLHEARALAAAQHAAREATARAPRSPAAGRLRRALGHGLMRLGAALAGEPARRARHA